jgi:hypothetical protein
LFNRNHYDRNPRPAGHDDDTRDMGHALCGRRGEVMVTRIREDVNCLRCRALLDKETR